MTVEEELFLEGILEERDRLFRESSRLKSQLSSYENFDSERASFQTQLQEKDQTIEKLLQKIQVLQRKIWGKSSDFQGAIQSDGYAVYDIYENKKGVLPIGCWAHCRRRFEEALKEDKARAEYALEQIGLLYDVERRADQENLSFDERAFLRSRLSYPIMAAFEKWMVAEYPKILPKGRIGGAIKYTYGIYHKLTRYHLDGRFKMDNNLAENAIRPIALGRKNWLFCGNHDAAENAAIMYSMFGCCKASGVNFREWLVFFLNNIHSYDNDYNRDLAELLPHNFSKIQNL